MLMWRNQLPLPPHFKQFPSNQQMHYQQRLNNIHQADLRCLLSGVFFIIQVKPFPCFYCIIIRFSSLEMKVQRGICSVKLFVYCNVWLCQYLGFTKSGGQWKIIIRQKKLNNISLKNDIQRYNGFGSHNMFICHFILGEDTIEERTTSGGCVG